MEYWAHIRESDKEKQSLEDHLKGVAELAGKFAEIFNAKDWAYIAGLWHDVGKYSSEFQKRLIASCDNNENSESIPGKVDHSTAGAQHSCANLNQPGKIIAYAIAGHHTGLPDGKNNERSSLEQRLKKSIPDFSACRKDIQEHDLKPALPFTPSTDKNRACIQFWMFIRMLFSSLVDADFLDTEAFMNPDKTSLRERYPGLEELWSSLTEELTKKKSDSSKINIKRAEILEHCLKAAKLEPGLFSLTVPTGGGKTLSSLAFALKHALKFGMKRVIYVIPFTSIIEQNADVFRRILGDDAVLEHHSNFEPDIEDFRSRMASENWDAPLVVTTNVQFFESIFACRTSASRKLHNIAGSVVIIDEAQMLPAHLLKPCLEALRELTAHYQVSSVLCTATQPALLKRQDFSDGLENVREIVPDTVSLYESFKRVQTNILPEISDDDITQRLSDCRQALCIVNKRNHAKEIFEKIKNYDGAFHLSALMCPAHRTKVLGGIRERLSKGETCRVVCTSLIEAGVDIDFPVVFRALSGIDSIAQAAGRCNREGNLDGAGKVFVFTQKGSLPPGYMKMSAQTAEPVLRRHEDPLSLEAVEDYFRSLYWLKGSGLDQEGILADIAEGGKAGDFPFRKIAEKFKIIDDRTFPVIIPYNDEARRIINEIKFSEFPSRSLRKAQRYSVQIYQNQLATLINAGSIETIGGQYYVLANTDIYRDDIGLFIDDPTFRTIEGLIA